jgi:DNA-binding transcriptional MerR regulator
VHGLRVQRVEVNGGRSRGNPAPASSPHPIESGEITITALARATNVASSALRYYEAEGLIAPLKRTKAGYRLYDAEARDRVLFIRMAQDAGLTLDDIRAVLEPRGSTAACGAVRGILKQRLSEVRARIAALRRFEQALVTGISCRPKRVSDLCRSLCAAAGSKCASPSASL